MGLIPGRAWLSDHFGKICGAFLLAVGVVVMPDGPIWQEMMSLVLIVLGVFAYTDDAL